MRRGENAGRKLQHVAVVRSLTLIGNTTTLTAAPLRFTLNAPEATDPALLEVVVFAQVPLSGGPLSARPSIALGPILGAVTSRQIVP